MAPAPENWKTQIRKGYLELCLLRLIDREDRIYGFDLIEKLSAASLEVKEGTLYPLLNRLNADGLLSASWETENLKGHPRKFYALTASGRRALEDMNQAFEQMVAAYQTLGTPSRK